MREDNDTSRKLLKLMEVVDEVAFQASILALQASVAAAGAGENGLGFARTADEVRDLARRGAQAAKEPAVPLPHSTSSRKPFPVGEGERIS
jgi:methyl-accepting chemotaxis protein